MKKYKYKEVPDPNICLLIRDLTAGGAQKQSIILANLLAGDYNVTLMVQHKDPINNRFYEMIDQSVVKLVILKGNFLKKLIYCIHYIKINTVNIVFAYLTSDNLLASLSGLFIPKVKVIGGIRNCTIQAGKYFLLLVLHRLIQNRTIFNSYSGFQNFTEKGFKASKCHVIHNTVDNFIPKIHRKSRKLIKIISVGRFVRQKDYFTALESVRLLVKQINQTSLEFKYIIIGYGKFNSKIRRFINHHNMNNITQIVLNPGNIEDYYVDADIYLSTSLFEGLSNTIMEAMNYSLPVVATNVGDNNKLVIHRETGFLCIPGQPSAVAHYLNLLLRDNDLRLRYGLGGNDFLRKNFSNEVFLSRYNEFIRELVN